MKKVQAAKAALGVAGLLVVTLAIGPTGAAASYTVSHAASGQASGPAATWSARSAIDETGSFALNTSVDDPTSGAGLSNAVASVRAAKTVDLAPGRYTVTVTLGNLAGSAEERDGADAVVNATLDVVCLNCLTTTRTDEILAASEPPNRAVTPYASRTLYGDTRTVTWVVWVTGAAPPVQLAVDVV